MIRILIAACFGLGASACQSPVPPPAPEIHGPVPAAEPAAAPAPLGAVVSAPAPKVVQAPALPTVSKESPLASLPRRHWYGVYMMGTKVGYAEMHLRRAGDGEPGAWLQLTHLHMEVEAGGEKTFMGVDEMRAYGAEAPHPLVASTFVETTPLGRTEQRIDIRQNQLQWMMTQGDQPPQTRLLGPTEESLEALWATVPPSLEGVEAGQVREVRLFDWPSLADTAVRVEVLHVGKARRAGVELRVATLSVRYASTGVTMESRIVEGGDVLETRIGLSLVLRMEEESVARSGVQGLDILGAGVPVSTALGYPGDREHLELEITVPPGLDLPSAPNQRVSPKEAGEVHVVLSSGPGTETRADELGPATAPGPQIDSDHPEIRAQAARLVEAVDGRANQVQALVDFTYKHLDKALATHIPSASGALRQRRGDCTEHTWLFVALCRAAGIPARPAFGLMYLGDRDMSFGYHAWAEVALEGRWHPVDPTWRQNPVDATHLKLGDTFGAVAQALGQIRIRVVE